MTGIGVGPTLPTLTVGGSLNLELTQGQSGITFGGETTLFRERANVLKTGSSFVTVGSLGVLGIGAEQTLPTLIVGGSLSLELINGQSGITFGGETTLFRERANVLTTGSSFVIVGSLGVLGVGVEPTLPTLTVVGSLDLQLTQGRTGITFGETTLFRKRPNVLKTGSSFVTAGSLGVTGIGVGPTLPTLTVGGSLNLVLTQGQSGITFGGETTLFRERANVLKTGSSFVTVGSLGILGIGVEQTLPTLIVGGSLSLELINGQSGITFGAETTLFRERANVLKTGSSFVTVGSLGVLGVGVEPTLPTLTVVGSLDLQLTQGRTGITFGETTLFRERPNVLKTGSSFVTAGSLGVTGIGVSTTQPTLTVGGSLNLVLTQGQSGITFGGETTLFRERANVLKTGSSFVTVGSLGILGIGVEQTLPTLIVGGSLSLELINGQSGITFGAETTLFRERANVLKTGSSFVTVGSLGVLGVGVEPTLPTLTVVGSLDLQLTQGRTGITFGETTLFRERPNVLKTGSSFVTAGSLGVTGIGVSTTQPTLTVGGSLNLNVVNGVAGITFGGETTLFRSSANVLRTGGDFEVSGATTILGNAVLTTDPTLTVTGSLSIIAVASNAGITFGGDTTLSRLRERELQVSSALVVGGSLSVLGSGLADGSASLTAAGSLNLNIVGGVAGITFGRDTTLFRDRTNVLRTGGDFEVSGATTILGNAVLTTAPTLTVTGSLNIIAVASNAGITFGGDTTLSRLRERELQVSSALVVGGSLSVLGSGLDDGSASLTAAGSLNLNIVGGVAGITFGRDTTLFRDRTNVLRTGGDFDVSGAVTILGNGVSTTSPALTVTGSLDLNVVNGIAGITFGETTLFRDRANVLRTGSSFITAGSLGVSGIGVDPTLATLTVGGSLNLQLTNGESGITFGGETTLFRSSANVLRTGGDFEVSGATTILGNAVLTSDPTLTVTGSLNIIAVASNAGITFGGDTTLSRLRERELQVSSALVVGGSLSVLGSGLADGSASLTAAGSLNLSIVGGVAGITFGGETTLFRSSANVLRTGGDFEVSGATTILGNAVLTTDPTLTVTGSLNIIAVASNAGITFGGDTTLSRLRERELQVSSALVVGGSLSVLGSGLADGSASLTAAGSLNLNIVGGVAGITFGRDTTLFRDRTNVLRTGGDFEVSGATTILGNAVLTTDPTLTVTGSLNIIAVASNAGITFGGDTTLSRLRERELQVSSALVVGGSLSVLGSGLADGSASLTAAGSLNLNIVGGVAGITFGGETTLFRASANVLKTGGDFDVSGAVTILGNGVLTTSPALTVTGSLNLNVVNGIAGITFGETTLFRDRANVLRTGSSFITAGSLGVSGIGVDPTLATLTVGGSLNLDLTNGQSGITFGGETTLFRSSANVLKTGGDFEVSGATTILGNGVLTTSSALTVDGSLNLDLTNGQSGITFGGETTLFRSSANVLKTGGDFDVSGAVTILGNGVSTTSPALTVTGSLNLNVVNGIAGITFGETTLFRERANVLTTGSSFIAAGSLGVSGIGVDSALPTLTVGGSLDLQLTNSQSGITFGGETTLFRERANVLKTGGAFVVGGSLIVDGAFELGDDLSIGGALTVGGSGVSTTSPTLTVTGSLALNLANSQSGITFGGETTLFRDRANVLKTGGSFVAGGSLGILGAGVLTTEPTLTVVGSLALNLANGQSGITFGGDTTLFRSAANELKTANDLVIGGSLTLSLVTGDLTSGITFGTDTYLFRSSGGQLTISGSLNVEQPTLTVGGSLNLDLTNGQSGITFGGETTLFRSSANVLKTGGDFEVSGATTILGNGVLTTSPALTVGGSLNLDLTNGQSGITFGGETTLFRDQANTLKTGGNFEVSGATTILGNGVLTTSPTLTVGGSLDLQLTNGQSGITFGGDTTLFRSAANELKTGNDLVIGGSLTLSLVTGDLTSGITFGTDTYLFRSSGGQLTISGSLNVEQPTLTVGGSLNLDLTNGQSGITFGGETTLFRSSANVLQTGQDFIVGRDLTVVGVTTVSNFTVDDSLVVEGSLTLSGSTGGLSLTRTDGASTSGITFGGDRTLFRTALGELQVEGPFVITGSLHVGLNQPSKGLSLHGGAGGPGDGIIFDSEDAAGSVNLYATKGGNTLKTDDSFVVLGSLTLSGTGSGLSLTRTDGASTSGITFAGDTNLFRSESNVLTTGSDDSFVVLGSLTLSGSSGGLSLTRTDGASTSGITFGGDTSLFRSGASVISLGSDDTLLVGGSLTVSGSGVLSTVPTLTVTGSLLLNVVNGISGITLGETTLFRDRANVLKTGGSFITAGSLGVSGIGVGTTLPTLTVGGSLDLQLTNSQSGITFGGETTLFRDRANVLKTGGSFVAGGSLGVLGAGVLTTEPTLTVVGSLALNLANGESGITFGGETTLFREVANVLKTGGSFVAGGSLGILGAAVLTTEPTLTVGGSLQLNLANSQSGITFGGETTLFRDRANVLKTGSSFVAGGSLGILGAGVLTTEPTLTVAGSLALSLANGESGITFGGETTLFRDRANVLKTGSSFVAGGSLGILGAGVLTTEPALTVAGSLALNLANSQSGITFGGETTLFRDRANVLKTGGSFVAGGSLGVFGAGVNSTLPTLTVTGSLNLIAVASNAAISFGGDTSLVRIRANELQASGDLVVGGSLSILGSGLADGSASLTAAGSLSLNIVGGVAGITFGRDTTLFRESANQLKTGGDFEVSGATTILGNAVLTTDPTLTVTGSLSILAVASNAAISFGGDTSLTRVQAGELQASGDLVVGGSLTVTGSGLASGLQALTVRGSLSLNSFIGDGRITFGDDTTLFREPLINIGDTGIQQALKTPGVLVVGASLLIRGVESDPNATMMSVISNVGERTGIVPVQIPNTVFRLTAAGSLFLDQGITAAGQLVTKDNAADLAEDFNVLDDAAAGDLVSAAGGPDVIKSSGPYEANILGVIASDPAIILRLYSSDGVALLANPKPVALAGRVPVNVTNENGPIQVGDYITSSSTPGHGMKATEAGPVIGMALENLDEATGQVLIKVANTWWLPSSSGQSTLTSLVGTTDTITDLKAGTATFTELNATRGSLINLSANTGAFNSLVATSAFFDGLRSTSDTFSLLESASARFEALEADSGTFDKLEAGSGTFTNLVVIDGSFETLEADSATFGTVEATDGLTVGEGGDTATIVRHLSAVAALDFRLPASSCQDLTLRVEGAGTSGDTVAVGAPSTLGQDLSVTGFVSGPDTVTVRLCNPTTQLVDPESGSYRVDVWQHE